MHMRTVRHTLLITLFCAGCGGDNGRNGEEPRYTDDQTVISGAESGVYDTPDGDDCIELESGACISPQDECGDDGTAQVVVDGAGNVLRTRCIEHESDILYADEDGIPADDDAFVVIDEGLTVDGDITFEGNGTVVVADGEGATIDGDVTVGGDQNLISGVRITGDLHLTGSGATAVDCIVEGNVRIPGNGGILANCVVFGSIDITGNSARLVFNDIQGEVSSSAMTLECDGNQSFVDENEDLVLQEEEEITDPLECGGEDGGGPPM